MKTNLEFELAPLPELEPSPLLDYSHPSIEQLIVSRGWNAIEDQSELMKGIFLFIRDEIAYGYTKSFSIPASQVLSDGVGNGITKSTLFMALLRAVGIPCRLYAARMNKIIFRGLLKGLSYRIATRHPFRTWVELQFMDKWYPLDGFIIDKPYMQKLQQKFPNHKTSFYGYGIGVMDFKDPDNIRNNNHVNVCSKAIEKPLGTFITPDAFFSEVPEADTYAKDLRYKTIICDRLNRSIQRVRNAG